MDLTTSNPINDVHFMSSRYGAYSFEFKRVSVILGANGCGKSKLLTEIRDNASVLTGGYKAVYIEGGRTIKIRDVLQLDHANVGQYDRYETALSHYENKRIQALADRVFDALLVLDKRDSHIRARHSDAVVKWQEGGMESPCPIRRQPPLERLFELFNEIFPQIKLTYERDARQLFATKNGTTYGPSGLSDGEKQVFSILADLIELEDAHKLIIADEPELNLHPELAERVWTLLENEFPEKRFIYATHSIGFALRETVQSVYVLSAESANISVFSGLENLPRAEVTSFLGALPGVLSANRVLVTEGHEKSFDAIFYRWLLGDEKLEIFPGGGCLDVSSICEKRGLWNKISTRISLVGVIDADYRSDELLQGMSSTSVHILPFHEAESFLCLPAVLCEIANRIGSQEELPTPIEIENKIIKKLSEEKLVISARRVFAKAKISLAVSVDRKLLSSATDRQVMIEEIRSAAMAEQNKAIAVGPDQVAKTFDEEVSGIEAVIASRNIDMALKLLPGKELLAQLAPRTGCRNSADLMRSLRRNFKPTDFPKLLDLAEKIRPQLPT